MDRKIAVRLKNLFLILFIFSLPFEYYDPFGVSSFFSLTKMVGFCYAAIAILTVKRSFDYSIFHNVRYLVLLWIWLVILSMLNYTGVNTQSYLNFTLLQNIVFYWLVASDLKKGNVHINTIMLSFVISIFFMNALISAGIGIGQEYIEDVSRITFFGNNPNTVGILAGLAIVFSSYFILNPEKTFGKKSYFAFFALPGFLDLLMLSGSRGALITTGASIAIMIIMNRTTSYKKIIQYGFLVFATGYFMDVLTQSDLMYKRITQFIEEGNTAGRMDIWRNVMSVSFQKPIIGHGTTGFEFEMSKIYGRHKAAHNLFLYILVTTGMIGIGIFMRFLYFHFKEAVTSFRRRDVMKIILLIFYLTTVVKAGGVINSKLMWMLLAIIISANFMEHKNFLRPIQSRLKFISSQPKERFFY